MSWQKYVFVGFALACNRLSKSRAFVFNAQSSNCISEVSCSLSFKFWPTFWSHEKFWPTNIRPMLTSFKIVSKMNLLFSWIQSLHRLLEVGVHGEEEYSVFLTLRSQRANILVVQHQSTFFPRWVKFLWMGWQEYVFVVLLWPVVGLQNHVHSMSTQNCRTASRRFPALCCRSPCRSSLWPTCSTHEKFWPTSENCLCLQIQF